MKGNGFVMGITFGDEFSLSVSEYLLGSRQVSGSLSTVDLSGITSLEGNIRVLGTLPKLQVANFSHCPNVTGDIRVFEKCPELREVKKETTEARVTFVAKGGVRLS